VSPRVWLWTVVLMALACRAAAPETRPDDDDSDDDGIRDVADLCPDDREDRDGFEDWDGCPDVGNGAVTWNLAGADAAAPDPDSSKRDTDADGVTDDLDTCPRDGEDRDGFEDADGCPELDNDKDRVLDAEDKCPNEPETYNARDDEDGCPDFARTGLPLPPPPRPRRALPFAARSADLTAEVKIVLDQVASVLNDRPELGTCVIEGHADRDEPGPAALAAARAEAVRQGLVLRHVLETRLSPRSSAARQPMCRERTAACRGLNARVELHLPDAR
jgi:outer membrane protein OmpA-like peptidoglycan-associated protein